MKKMVKLKRSSALRNHYLELKRNWKGRFWSFFQNQVKYTMIINLLDHECIF